MKLHNLTLITFSGAHATGKTTLLGDLAEELSKRPDTAVFQTESCSSKLFERIRSGTVHLPAGAQIPKTYDEINALGLRGFFQEALPNALAFEIEAALLRARADHSPKGRTFLLVDRWFADIFAYTLIESSDATLHERVLGRCRERLSDLFPYLLGHTRLLRVMNVFVPLKASNFRVEASDKFRATCDRALWEQLCRDRWTDVVGDTRALFVVTRSNRKARVTQLLSCLESPSPDTTSVT